MAIKCPICDSKMERIKHLQNLVMDSKSMAHPDEPMTAFVPVNVYQCEKCGNIQLFGRIWSLFEIIKFDYSRCCGVDGW